MFNKKHPNTFRHVFFLARVLGEGEGLEKRFYPNFIKKHWCCVTVLSLVIFFALFTLLPVPDYSCFTLKSNVPYVCESVKYLESDFSRLSVRLIKLVFDIDLNMKLLWSQDPLSKWYHNKSCSNPSRWNYFDF